MTGRGSAVEANAKDLPFGFQSSIPNGSSVDNFHRHFHRRVRGALHPRTLTRCRRLDIVPMREPARRAHMAIPATTIGAPIEGACRFDCAALSRVNGLLGHAENS